MFQGSDDFYAIGYSASDFVRYPGDMKSSSGYVFIVVGWGISWKSVKQTLTAYSTKKA